MPAAVFSLAFAAFAIGTTEFVIVGLLSDIGRAFGISVSTAGLLVSFYALAISIGTSVGSPPIRASERVQPQPKRSNERQHFDSLKSVGYPGMR
ncbi:hypothetical protein [Caballeronia sp. GAOx1]|uniref:hypothetical protein n=1 Tax=Caballeronia sp. GAOx1 TaxID=2921761 RepID=UPI002028A92B|nr:hypothetical protein [Caballeronia sp. GAOx1]